MLENGILFRFRKERVVIMEKYLLDIAPDIIALSPRASFGCDSGFFSLVSLGLCAVLLLKKLFDKFS